jgi:ElaB/YqjD/DUF883 family membrane-anchored ribosome-binding protein
MSNTQQLADSVQGALGKVADNQSPQLQALRTRVTQTVQSAKNVAGSADEYVRQNPWVAIGLIAGAAASLGFLAGYMAAPRKSILSRLRR